MRTRAMSFASFGVLLTAILCCPQPALSVPVQKTAGVGVISAGGGLIAASGVGAPVGAFIGGFEIGWGLGCLLFDPPDTVNAGVPVDLSMFSTFMLPESQSLFPTIPMSLATTLDSYADLMDGYVANTRAYRASLDRSEGALILGRPDWASERAAEGEAFRDQALDIAGQAVSALPALYAAINAYDPSLLSMPLTLSDTTAFRDTLKMTGTFPSFEMFAVNAWALTDAEKAALLIGLGNIPDSALSGVFQQLDPVNGTSTSIGSAVAGGTAVCATCLGIPEPSTAVGSESGVLLLLALAGRLRPGHPPTSKQ